MSISVLDDVGNFDERFFIDYVDIEWGLRAKSLGFSSYGVCGAALEHSLAEGAISFWFLKTWSVPVHMPIRHYYFFGNAVLLYRRPLCLSRPETAGAVYAGVRSGILFHTVRAPRSQRLTLIALGLYDGLRKHSGPFRGRRADKPSDAMGKRPGPVRPGLR